MIYFIKQARLDGSIDLSITPKGKKTIYFNGLTKSEAEQKIINEGCSYWYEFLKNLLLSGVIYPDVKKQEQAIVNLYNAANLSRRIELIKQEAQYLAEFSDLSPSLAVSVQNLLEWLKSAENSSSVQKNNVLELTNQNITFENEENRPSIESFLNNFNKR